MTYAGWPFCSHFCSTIGRIIKRMCASTDTAVSHGMGCCQPWARRNAGPAAGSAGAGGRPAAAAADGAIQGGVRGAVTEPVRAAAARRCGRGVAAISVPHAPRHLSVPQRLLLQPRPARRHLCRWQARRLPLQGAPRCPCLCHDSLQQLCDAGSSRGSSLAVSARMCSWIVWFVRQLATSLVPLSALQKRAARDWCYIEHHGSCEQQGCTAFRMPYFQ